jgi:hypothetical protein
MIWTDIACEIPGFSPPETFLADLRSLFGHEYPLVRENGIKCLTAFICHHQIVDALDVLQDFAVLARDPQWSVVEAALCDFGDLVHEFFEPLSASDCFAVYLDLVREVGERFPDYDFADIYFEMAKVAMKLLTGGFAIAQEFADLIRSGIAQSSHDRRVFARLVRDQPDFLPLLELLSTDE